MMEQWTLQFPVKYTISRRERNLLPPVAPSETTTKSAERYPAQGTKTHTKSATAQLPLFSVGDCHALTDVFKGPADQEFETDIQDEQAEEEVQHPSDWFQKPTKLPSPDHAWNTSVPAAHENVQPWLSSLAQQDPRESFDELTDSTFDFSAFITGQINGYGRLGANQCGVKRLVKFDRSAIWGISHWWQKADDSSMHFATSRESLEMVDDDLYMFNEGDFHRTNDPRTLKIYTKSGLPATSNLKETRLLYSIIPNPRGFILYENKRTRRNRLLRIDELHKFSDGGLDKGFQNPIDPARNVQRDLTRDIHFYTGTNQQGVSQNLSRLDHVTRCTTLPASQSQIKSLFQKLTEIHISIDSHSELVDIEKVALSSSLRSLKSKCTIEVNSFTMKMEILLESTSNKLMVEHAEYDESNTYVLERFNTSAGNPVKKILLKLNLSDHRLCKMVVECQSVKVKEFQERCNIKAFQEWYEHVGPEVASPQDGKVTRWRRDCAWLMISRCSRSQCQIQVQGTSSIQEVNDHYNIFTRESQEYELKTKDKA
ncbi:hypothetical protein Tco_0368617 [Tanacetum coccineum]